MIFNYIDVDNSEEEVEELLKLTHTDTMKKRERKPKRMKVDLEENDENNMDVLEGPFETQSHLHH